MGFAPSCYDFCDPQWYSLTGYNFRFRIPTTRTTGLPGNGIDANGLEPDVRIPLDYPNTLTDNIDEWTLWVKDRLEHT